MTMIVEDGTGLTNSNSYLSEADADTYLSDRGLDSVWTTKTSAEKEAALISATQYLDASYEWIGYLVSLDQALDWPRVDAYDNENRNYNNTVPQPLKDATAELALASLVGRLSEIQGRDKFTKREKVGQLEVEYFAGTPADRRYSFVNRLLSNLVIGGAGSINGSQAPLRRT